MEELFFPASVLCPWQSQAFPPAKHILEHQLGLRVRQEVSKNAEPPSSFPDQQTALAWGQGVGLE